MTDTPLTPEQQDRLDKLSSEMMHDNANRTLDRWTTELVEWRRRCRAMGNEPTFRGYIQAREHAARSRHPKLVMVALAAALWRGAEEAEKRG